ncbi:MAG: hypothetical protein SA339_07125 [Methanomassiliicoccus sp.]|nr:hypothetical protein [Methanomassiliicoccus sp.]
MVLGASVYRFSALNMQICGETNDYFLMPAEASPMSSSWFASPIYLGTVSGEMRSLMERLMFPYLVYDAAGSTLFQRKIRTGLIYTMGIDEAWMKEMSIDRHIALNENIVKRVLGSAESLASTDIY